MNSWNQCFPITFGLMCFHVILELVHWLMKLQILSLQDPPMSGHKALPFFCKVYWSALFHLHLCVCVCVCVCAWSGYSVVIWRYDRYCVYVAWNERERDRNVRRNECSLC
jgi:hypothetical protein